MFALANHGRLRNVNVRKFLLRTLAVTVAVGQILPGSVFLTNTYGATVTKGTVKVKSGYVRSAASTTSSVSFCVTNNEPVAILSEEKGKDGNTWLKIAVGNSTGYIRSDLITKTDKKITVSDSVAKLATLDDNNKEQVVAQTSNTNKVDATSNTQGASISAQTGNIGTVKGTYVRMRKSASTTSGIAKVLNIGDIVNVVGEGKAADGQVWYQVKIDGMTGFIRSDLVNVANKTANDNTSTNTNAASNNQNTNNTTSQSNTNTETTYSDGSGTVNGTGVRVRDAAKLTSNVITSVNTGDKVTVIGQISADEKNWYKIKYTSNGAEKEGYIAADYVKLTVVTKKEEPKEEKKEEVKDDNKENSVANADAQNGANETNNNEQQNNNVQNSNAGYLTGNVGEGSACIKGVGVRIRQTPVAGNVICQLSSGYPLTVTGNEKGEDGYTWYKVTFSYQGNGREGYVRQDFVTITAEDLSEAPVGSEEFEATIASFPDSYKNSLRKLHASHPNWKFEAVNTGLDWNAALSAESSVGKNLVSKNSIASWKSTAAQAYNWSNNTWYTFDGGSWASASSELIAYYMDPRNFLNDSGIYQFETLDFSEAQTRDGVSKMLTGTFMSGDFTDTDGATYNYADAFMNIGRLTGVSPYLLAGRCLQEQGIYGTSQSVSGKVPGYENLFNYYNIGAYAYSGRTATMNGLIYAAGNDEDNLRPWNSRVRSIYGGAKYIAEKYVSKGQNTLYFQKFNVVNAENTIYSHQYMTNIQAASSESARLQLAYIGDDEPITFRIPVYSNMPATQCIKPTSDSNPNTYLASLSIDGYSLVPEFSGLTENYSVVVDSNLEYVTINASAVSPSSSVGGTGTYPINPGTNTLYVGCKSQSGAIKVYTITIQR